MVDLHLQCVVYCALEHCLSQQSYVDYAVRDYVLANKDKLDTKALSELIHINVDNQPTHKRAFWVDFMKRVM